MADGRGLFDRRTQDADQAFRDGFGAERRARDTDPATSREAAIAIGRRLSDIQLRVVELFEAFGTMTQHRAIALYRDRYGADTPESTVRTRCHELEAGGYLVEAGEVEIIEGGGRKAMSYRRSDKPR